MATTLGPEGPAAAVDGRLVAGEQSSNSLRSYQHSTSLQPLLSAVLPAGPLLGRQCSCLMPEALTQKGRTHKKCPPPSLSSNQSGASPAPELMLFQEKQTM